MFKVMLSARSIAFAFALFVVPFASGSAQAYQCKGSPHQSIGIKPLKLGAMGAARKNWSTSANSQFGLSWSVWKIAAARSVSCSKLNTGQWRCLASAKPCNYVVQ